jgi:hypothetical protein
MKKLKFAVLLVALASLVKTGNAQVQEMRYLFGGKGKVKVSGFIAPIMEYSAMGDKFAFFMGGGGAILFNQAFFFGAYGEGLTTQYYEDINYPTIDFPDIGEPFEERISFGHGGFWLGYIHHSQAPIHAGISSRFGWGSISPWEDDYKPNYSSEFADHVFVIIPQLEAEFNFFKWLKLNVGVGYRFVTDIDKSYGWSDELIYNKKDFNKPQATMTLMFGIFK